MPDLKTLEMKLKAINSAKRTAGGNEKSERKALDKEANKVKYEISKLATMWLNSNG